MCHGFCCKGYVIDIPLTPITCPIQLTIVPDQSLYLLLLLLILLPGCGSQDFKDDSVAMPAKGGKYRVPLLQNPSSLDPSLVHDEYGRVVNQQIFEGLVHFGPHLIIEPALAKTWSVEEDGKLYRFILRPNAVFHDGNPVTAHDVIFSLTRLLRTDPPPVLLPHLLMIEGAEEFRNGLSEEVAGLETPAGSVVTIRLKEPHTPLLVALGIHQAKIVPREKVLMMGEKFGKNPVGSGPFRFLFWEQDKQIMLERFSDYHGSPAHLQEIHFSIYPGGNLEKVLHDFETRELEEMPGYGSLREKLPPDSYIWLHRPALSLLYYGLRTDHPQLKNPLFRQALALAIDRRELVDTIYDGQFEPAVGIFPPGLSGYTPPNLPPEGDLARARDLVNQAFGPGRTPPGLEIVSASRSSFAQAELEYIRQRWALLGIEVTLKFITNWAEYEHYLLSDQVMVYRLVWTADMPDPDNFIDPLFSSHAASNFMHYANPTVHRIIHEARSINDSIERAQVYTNLEHSILEDSPLIPLFYLNVDRIYQPYVRDITLNALGFQDTRLHRVWLDTPAH
jgi:ABC-type transport system substrate-binding protein